MRNHAAYGMVGRHLLDRVSDKCPGAGVGVPALDERLTSRLRDELPDS